MAEVPDRRRRVGPDDGALLMMRRFVPILACLALAGCVTTGGGSVAGGECKVFEAPRYVIRGATQRDQDWIDPTIESGIGGCRWARPAPRPAEWDAVRSAPSRVAVKAAKKKKAGGWLWKALPTLARKKAAPSTPAVAPIAPAAPEPAPVPAAVAPAPRSAIDQLLHPLRGTVQ